MRLARDALCVCPIAIVWKWLTPSEQRGREKISRQPIKSIGNQCGYGPAKELNQVVR